MTKTLKQSFNPTERVPRDNLELIEFISLRAEKFSRTSAAKVSWIDDALKMIRSAKVSYYKNK